VVLLDAVLGGFKRVVILDVAGTIVKLRPHEIVASQRGPALLM
jgi:hypothetical protein